MKIHCALIPSILRENLTSLMCNSFRTLFPLQWLINDSLTSHVIRSKWAQKKMYSRRFQYWLTHLQPASLLCTRRHTTTSWFQAAPTGYLYTARPQSTSKSASKRIRNSWQKSLAVLQPGIRHEHAQSLSSLVSMEQKEGYTGQKEAVPCFSYSCSGCSGNQVCPSLLR